MMGFDMHAADRRAHATQPSNEDDANHSSGEPDPGASAPEPSLVTRIERASRSEGAASAQGSPGSGRGVGPDSDAANSLAEAPPGLASGRVDAADAVLGRDTGNVGAAALGEGTSSAGGPRSADEAMRKSDREASPSRPDDEDT